MSSWAERLENPVSARLRDPATSGYAGHITLWDLVGGKKSASRKLKAFGAYCIAFTPDGKSVVTGHDDHRCYVHPFAAP